jgi:hypothetical protein
VSFFHLTYLTVFAIFLWKELIPARRMRARYEYLSISRVHIGEGVLDVLSRLPTLYRLTV